MKYIMEAFLKGLAHTHKILYWLLQGSGPPNENTMHALSTGWPIWKEILFPHHKGLAEHVKYIMQAFLKGLAHEHKIL